MLRRSLSCCACLPLLGFRFPTQVPVTQRLDESGLHTEVRPREPFERIVKPNEPGLSGPVKDSQEPCSCQTTLARYLASPLLIQKHEACTHLLSQCYGLSLSWIEMIEPGVRHGGSRVDLEPFRGTCDPIAEARHGLQFVPHRQGNVNSLVQGRQEIHLLDQEQVADRRGVRDDLHRYESLLRVSMSSCRS